MKNTSTVGSKFQTCSIPLDFTITEFGHLEELTLIFLPERGGLVSHLLTWIRHLTHIHTHCGGR